MPLPQKRWFRVVEVAKRWAMPLSDIEDYALDEMLELSVFVVELPAATGIWKQAAFGHSCVPQEMLLLNGPQPLQRTSLLEIFRDGQAEVRAFRTAKPNTYLHLEPRVPAVLVRRDDLIVTREERDRFERDHGTALGAGAGVSEPPASDAWHSEDFSKVRVAGVWHSFGPKQAAVLRILKAAADTENPWRDGKKLLDEAGATTMRLIDLFKRKPAWRQLVLLEGKGRYRLNPDLLSPEQRRIRLFRKSGRITVRPGVVKVSR